MQKGKTKNSFIIGGRINKKRFLTLILSITSILMCICGLSACKEEHIIVVT